MASFHYPRPVFPPYLGRGMVTPRMSQTLPKLTLLVNVPSPKIHALGASFILGKCWIRTSFDRRL